MLIGNNIAFNSSPLPVTINGVHAFNAPLFEHLEKFDKEEIPKLFMEHMRVVFELDIKQEKMGKRKFQANYLRLLRGWFFDSNRPEGGVMKGWAESRFGLPPMFHGETIENVNSPAYMIYLYDKMHPRFHNNAIFSQFDLLYEYCQYYLKEFGKRKGRIKLYRGINHKGGDSQVLEKRDKKVWVVRNNSLVSYSSSVERASEFGDIILEVEIPHQKILCFPDILPGKLPSYEGEYIVLGGDYLSKVIDFF
ncbi:MAG: NAD(+)--dinitrogen-reductase ADP-D-ribosyltransferase [Nitrospinae bacterium]|nr:NAD(+)--dinitrogen-reductase ADP-D-ribosyltransferase [Nitrospinota bacterium]